MLELSYDNSELVFNDPKLPHLTRVMDTNAMAGHFT